MQHAPAGLDWGSYVRWLVEGAGSLTAVAEALADARQHRESIETIERALRRLRAREQGDGGQWGQRCLRQFGLPTAAIDRVRWMGQYHSRFTDLPASLGAELVRPWDRPLVLESRARAWVLLAKTSLALRVSDKEAAWGFYEGAASSADRAGAAAVAEAALVGAFLVYDHDKAAVLIDRAAEALPDVTGDDHACLAARIADQRAYPLNRPKRGQPAGHAAALALYAALPDEGPAFAVSRKGNGMAWTLRALGRRAEAVAWAHRSVEAAGDAGSLRLRAMALNSLAACTDDPEVATRARGRAQSIARHLEDEALAARFRRPLS
jgi:hypothetical protein